jgi:spore coat protein H
MGVILVGLLRALCLGLFLSQGAWAADESEGLFSKDQVIRILIQIEPAGVRALTGNPREYVPGSISKGTNAIGEARVRLKGNYSFRPINNKPGFSVSLSSLTAQKQFGGLRRFHLNNSVQDPSFMRSKLASELFLKAGLPTARINFASVTLNGRNLGLYLLVEATDETFLKRRFGAADGNLYEGANQDIADPLEIDWSSSAKTDRSDLQALLSICAEADLTKRWAGLKQMLNVNEFASFMAMEVLVGHFDGYSMDINNYRVYHDAKSGKFSFIAHGMDLTFHNPVLRQDRRWRGIVARAFHETADGRKLFHERLRELGTVIYGKKALQSDRVSELWKMIEPELGAEQERREALENVRKLQSDLQARAVSLPVFLERNSFQ